MLSLTALVFSRKLKRQFSREIEYFVETEVPRLANESRLFFGENPPTSTTQMLVFTGG